MKKNLLICILSILGLTPTHAQYNNKVEWDVFNHLSVGLGVGTTGISLDVAAPLTNYVAARAGIDILPNINLHPALDLGFDQEVQEGFYELFEEHLPNTIDFDTKVKFTAGHLLFDVYPFQKSSFHVTAGAYLGSKEIARLNTVGDQALLQAVYEYNQSEIREFLELDKIGVKLGNYFLEPDAHGIIKASLEVNALRPYIGIGFGRAIPTKHRFACSFDLGMQFWGSPKIYLDGANGKKRLDKEDLDPESGKYIKALSETTFWPVLNVRCVYRIF